MILPAFLHLKLPAFHQLHFLGKTHTADENGLVRDVPYDTARQLIDDPQHPAQEATDADIAAPGPAIPAAPEPAKPAKAKPAPATTTDEQ